MNRLRGAFNSHYFTRKGLRSQLFCATSVPLAGRLAAVRNLLRTQRYSSSTEAAEITSPDETIAKYHELRLDAESSRKLKLYSI